MTWILAYLIRVWHITFSVNFIGELGNQGYTNHIHIVSRCIFNCIGIEGFRTHDTLFFEIICINNIRYVCSRCGGTI